MIHPYSRLYFCVGWLLQISKNDNHCWMNWANISMLNGYVTISSRRDACQKYAGRSSNFTWLPSIIMTKNPLVLLMVTVGSFCGLTRALLPALDARWLVLECNLSLDWMVGSYAMVTTRWFWNCGEHAKYWALCKDLNLCVFLAVHYCIWANHPLNFHS